MDKNKQKNFIHCVRSTLLWAISEARAYPPTHPGVMPGFAEGHANARVLGLQGLEQRAGLIAGFSLVAPGITYPNHHHPPQEIYLVLSGGAWWQAGSEWHEPGHDGIVHNPPGILHAIRGTHVPLLAIRFLLPA